MEHNKLETYQGDYRFLKDSFINEQSILIAKLEASDRIKHPSDKGENNEAHFIDYLTKYLPKRYTVDKATVLDNEGCVSDSIDIVIFDKQYTPALFDDKKHRYVPAEAVYAVFECKPTINKETLIYAAEKIKSVRKLKRTSVEIHHAGGIYPPKKLFTIVGGILAINIDWKDGFGKVFLANHRKLTGKETVDCGFVAKGSCFDIFADGINFSYNFGPEKSSFAYFIFRLLWKLQTLATVPAIDWMAYANSLGSIRNNNTHEEVENIKIKKSLY